MNGLQKKIAAIAATAVAGGVIVAGAASLTSAQARPASDDWGKPAAQSTSGDGRKAADCLDIRETGRFHVVNDHTLLVYDTWQNPYLLDVGGPCRSMDDMSHFGFEVNGTTQVCRAHDAFLLFSHDTERPVRCLINGVKVVSRAEAARLDE
jgi:hypothetical protein